MSFRDIAGILTIVIQLIFLEGILSIDNAAVLGAMVSILPSDRPVPYPRPLHFLQRFTDRILGMQQSAALKVGLLGAYAGRGLMLVMATWVIENPVLKVIGAAYLIKLAFEQLSHPHQPECEDGDLACQGTVQVPFWAVVLNVELADLAFSLDNVVAAVALSNHLWVVMLGVALGIVTKRFAAASSHGSSSGNPSWPPLPTSLFSTLVSSCCWRNSSICILRPGRSSRFRSPPYCCACSTPGSNSSMGWRRSFAGRAREWA